MPLIREGSSERNVDTLVPGIVKNNLPTDNMMFCTDDKHVNDIFKEGHISYNVKRSIELGLDPVQAIQMATHQCGQAFSPGRQNRFSGTGTFRRYSSD